MTASHDHFSREGGDSARLAVLRWTAAGIIVVAAHAGAAWIMVNWKPVMAAPSEPPPAVMIELAALAVAPETPPQEVAPGPQQTEAQPDTALDTPDTPVEEIEPDPMPPEPDKPIEERPPELTPPVPSEEVLIPDPPKVEKAEAVLEPPPPPQPKVQKKPPPKQREVERKKPINPDKPKARQTTAPPTSEARRANTAAAPAAGAESSVSPASWRGTLMAHLNRYKRFPAGAAGNGVASVAFTINRSGQVTSVRMIGASGDGVLDQEAVALLHRASPVPSPPPSVGSGGAVTLTVPIRFNR